MPTTRADPPILISTQSLARFLAIPRPTAGRLRQSELSHSEAKAALRVLAKAKF